MSRILSRLEALERASRAPMPAALLLRVTFKQGATVEHVAELERQALAVHVAAHGEPQAPVSFIRRIMVRPIPILGEPRHA